MDEYGFERPEDFNYALYEEFMSAYLRVLAKRAKKWSDLLSDGKSLKKNVTIKRYVRKGIPSKKILNIVFSFLFHIIETNQCIFNRWSSKCCLDARIGRSNET